MPCGCGGANSKQNYVFTDPTGKQRAFRTEVEAKAAQIRAGGGGSIRTVPR